MPTYQSAAGNSFVDGSGDASWINEENMDPGVYPGTYAQVTLGTDEQSNKIHGYAYNFASMPDSDRIVGIEVLIEADTQDEWTGADMACRLDLVGSPAGSTKTENLYIVSGIDAFYTYGSPTDVWGLTDVQLASIKDDPDFGVAWTTATNGGPDVVRLYNIIIKLYTVSGRRHVKRSDC